jgi:hypothetical protein
MRTQRRCKEIPPIEEWLNNLRSFPFQKIVKQPQQREFLKYKKQKTEAFTTRISL